ncbi:hypothetical protein VMCG_05979 [Cytospora schulzeri]|uniref:Uncharacterized protein n=1 Tax=Cytospora schulzeri TaxID=448051 RepID=A0A423WD03_9PEZI|nr:hypothetical protein VMCG_05979 [Valsa malicola]
MTRFDPGIGPIQRWQTPGLTAPLRIRKRNTSASSISRVVMVMAKLMVKDNGQLAPHGDFMSLFTP